MSKELKEVFARAESWPAELQEKAVETLLTLEEWGTGSYRVSDSEWADMREGIDQAKRGEFAPDATVVEADKHLGV